MSVATVCLKAGRGEEMATTLPLCVHSLKLHEAFFQLHFQPAWALFASFWAKLGGSDNQAPTTC